MIRPRHLRRAGVLIGIVMAVAACGGGGDDAAAAGSLAPAQSKVVITPETAATPFQLQSGLYRFGWSAPDCKSLDFTLAGQSKGFTYAKKSNLPTFNSIMSNVLDDAYVLTQADPGCTTWTVNIDRMGS
jgi:hypothetical protein